MSETPAIRMEAELSGLRVLADRSVKVSFTSLAEVSDADLLYLFRRQTSSGWLLYDERRLDEADIPQDALSSEVKSPSARLRSLLFVLWKLRFPDHAQRTLNTFSGFYAATMETFADAIRKKIDLAEGGGN